MARFVVVLNAYGYGTAGWADVRSAILWPEHGGTDNSKSAACVWRSSQQPIWLSGIVELGMHRRTPRLYILIAPCCVRK